MSDAYLQQCGEDSEDRQSFAFGVEVAYGDVWSIASGSDPDAYVASGLPWVREVFLDRDMDPGWWQFDMEIDIPYNGDPTESRSVYLEADYDAGTPVDISLPLQWFPSASVSVLSHKMIAAISGDSCKRVRFNLEVNVFHNDPTVGQVFTVNVTGSRLACPNCPEPI